MKLRNKPAPAAAPAAAAPAPAAAPASSGADPIVAKALDVLVDSTKNLSEQIKQQVKQAVDGLDRSDRDIGEGIDQVVSAIQSMTQAVLALAQRPVQVTVEMPASTSGRKAYSIVRDDEGRMTGVMVEEEE